MPFNNGEVFAGYVIQRMIGTGGMGEVYLAQHPRLPRQDALKILSSSSTTDEEFRARFVREAELAATLWHPHIVRVLDRGEFNGRLWISMDYVDGTDAGRLIQERYPDGMPEQEVSEIVMAMADALDFGHERRLLHRDVKPENILVTAFDGHRRRVLLTDPCPSRIHTAMPLRRLHNPARCQDRAAVHTPSASSVWSFMGRHAVCNKARSVRKVRSATCRFKWCQTTRQAIGVLLSRSR